MGEVTVQRSGLVEAAQTALAAGDRTEAEVCLREAVQTTAPRAHRMLGGLLLLDDDLAGALSTGACLP